MVKESRKTERYNNIPTIFVEFIFLRKSGNLRMDCGEQKEYFGHKVCLKKNGYGLCIM